MSSELSPLLGSTEGTGVVSMCPVRQKIGRFGGVFVPGVDGRVVKADGTSAGYNEEGELHIRTPASAIGYLHNDNACVLEMHLYVVCLICILGLAKPS